MIEHYQTKVEMTPAEYIALILTIEGVEQL